MKWPPSWLPERLAAYRPEPLHLAAAAAGGVSFLVVVITVLLITSPWSGGGDDAEVSCSPCPTGSTPSLSPSPSDSPNPSPSPCCTETPQLTAPPTRPPTAAPTDRPQTPPPAPVGPPAARLAQLFAWGGSDARLTDMAMYPGSPDEAVVITQNAAQAWRVSISSAHQPILFGDLSAYVGGGGNEEGLLTLAFSPQFASDGRVYVYYTKGAPQPTVLARFQVANGVMDSGQQTVILEVPDFASNHNGGKIAFGPDGYLYLSTGDGGGGGDPQENGQNVNTLLGKILRLNVTGQHTYSVPGDNPFVGTDGLDELWAYGFRNPWRISFDRATGDLWVGDVGQNAWEEVDKAVRGGNHGWDCYEGFAVFESTGCPAGGFVQPRTAYPHSGGRCSITGGYVYRGGSIPSLSGWYVYADYCSGEMWAVNPAGGEPVLLANTSYSISSFAELPGGELAVLTFDNAVFVLAP